MSLQFQTDIANRALTLVLQEQLRPTALTITICNLANGMYFTGNGWEPTPIGAPYTIEDASDYRRLTLTTEASEQLYSRSELLFAVPEMGLIEKVSWPPTAPEEPTVSERSPDLDVSPEVMIASNIASIPSEPPSKSRSPLMVAGLMLLLVGGAVVSGFFIGKGVTTNEPPTARSASQIEEPRETALKNRELLVQQREEAVKKKELELDSALRAANNKSAAPITEEYLSKREAELNRRENALSQKLAAAEKLDSELRAMQTKFNSKKDELTSLELSLARREAIVSEREAALYVREADLDKRERDSTARLDIPSVPSVAPSSPQNFSDSDNEPSNSDQGSIAFVFRGGSDRPYFGRGNTIYEARTAALSKCRASERHCQELTPLTANQFRCFVVAVAPLGRQKGFGWGRTLNEAGENSVIDCKQSTQQNCRVDRSFNYCVQ